ncbi:MAG: ATP-dependent 6-phosphofructokinase [Rhodospirillales bacterium]|nr:ATP-dependent 6-phosphofructokinase [Rhodospirillales bacterium]
MAKTKKKRIGLLTSGGDCAGLNAAIRAVVCRAVNGYNWDVVGIKEGTAGLLERPPAIEELTLRVFTGNILRMGGTILGTVNKGNPFAYPMPDGSTKDRSEEVIEGFRELGLDALIGIGGDGSMRILSRLAQQGKIPFVGIPKTIDNDVAFTEWSIGFNSSVAVATDALDCLQPTAASHQRVMVLEVMGRDAGHIAITAGIAGGANVILIPEIPYDIQKVADHINKLHDMGRNHFLVICAEAVKTASGESVWDSHADGEVRYGGIGHIIGDQIQGLTGAETRVTALGHVARGGSPVAMDRMLASAFGVHAVDLVAQGKYDRLVVWQHREVVDVPIEEVITRYREVDVNGTLVRTARGLGICLGD